MPILGAVLAGGQSRRFGSDKALARIDGRTLFSHVLSSIAAQVDEVVVCGRNWPGLIGLSDCPGPGLGPLGGLCAALFHARDKGFGRVLSVAIDTYPLPHDLVKRLNGPKPSILLSQHLIGVWPSDLAASLLEHLNAGNRSIRSWIAACVPEVVDDTDLGLCNINFQRDLDQI